MNFSEPSGKLRIAFVLTTLFLFATAITALGQDRDRVVVEKEKAATETSSRPATRSQGLTNDVRVIREPASNPLIKKTGSSALTTAPKKTSASYYNSTVRSMIVSSINEKLGSRYVYGTQGPNTYDCSGFVWKVFEEAGLPFTRTSAAEFWRTFEPVQGDDRFQFGTLVFFNRLGHVGIVVNKDGFYHASTSKGVTYSKFEGYWEKRIVGYRRVPLSALVFDEPGF